MILGIKKYYRQINLTMINTVIFDLGAVLIDWNPHYLYRKIFREEAEMLRFLENICTSEWNEEQDGGRSLQEATDYLVAKYPEHEENIRAFYGRWEEMLGNAIEGTVEIFRELKESKKYKIYALTNWSAETFPIAQERFEFLQWFDGIVVSGTEKNRKPFPSFYQLLLDRYQVKPEEAIFIDDNLRNIKAAEQIGITSFHFTSPAVLREALEEKGILTKVLTNK
jgi:2-haloacid dehalogenase